MGSWPNTNLLGHALALSDGVLLGDLVRILANLALARLRNLLRVLPKHLAIGCECLGRLSVQKSRGANI